MQNKRQIELYQKVKNTTLEFQIKAWWSIVKQFFKQWLQYNLLAVHTVKIQPMQEVLSVTKFNGKLLP